MSKEDIGWKALREVSEMVLASKKERELLLSNGWIIVREIPIVNNERLWYHPVCKYKTQSEALKWVET